MSDIVISDDESVGLEKPKRVLSEKQKEALAKGRELRKAKKEAKAPPAEVPVEPVKAGRGRPRKVDIPEPEPEPRGKAPLEPRPQAELEQPDYMATFAKLLKETEDRLSGQYHAKVKELKSKLTAKERKEAPKQQAPPPEPRGKAPSEPRPQAELRKPVKQRISLLVV